ncbi:MAG: alpha-amylase family glycosyl hydrolase [Calditrichia bacterium]
MKTNEKAALKIQLTNLENESRPAFLTSRRMEFHISREARIKYQFDETLFSTNGNVIFPNFRAVRVFVQKMNDKRNVINFPEKTVKAGQMNAMGLIDEIMHYVAQIYREQKNDKVMKQALDRLEKEIGKDKIDSTFRKFVDDFPPMEVYKGGTSADQYLANSSEGVSNRELVLEEMIAFWIANSNPAVSPFIELFDDTSLEKETAYKEMMESLHSFFDTQPTFGPDNQNLIDMLQSPALAAPYSLSAQLEYIRQKWGLLLGKFLYRLLSSLDLIKEEEKSAFLGPGPARVYEFGLEVLPEPERFSPDKDWMPRVVLLAKSTYVWLDQLSKKYQRPINHLDQVPDEELDQLARWGFTGLWLIGLWERSRASKNIKQMCGNPEAVASAYALLNYQIAEDLGGEPAYQNLRERAWKRGIRMSGDMVPNHMGIDSGWVIEHPDWFVSLNYSPFPSYTFNGPNLSWDDRVYIAIEDHYYTRSDASVVFKRVDTWTGDTRFIYHGNDGTSMPWNDTAQLNYLIPEVREAVIQTILDVARRFPIIRFDAAMTLTKKHYQRLWFPEPGTGGDIPTRAEHGMTRGEFDSHIPEEFWREVVDRVAREVPDTLLLAEAFWLMEGYFVRSLGMHRVYNSAFMNMLKMENNAQYRQSVKNVLEFNPEILKRFVNFMNNPDEETAVAQFGKGDKYFGVCTMLVTMPGLPMFGHGQLEGFTEKYGMEYRRAYWDEQPDRDLIHRHEREIFPLMRKRHIFANVENFNLYDFYVPEGYVNENVFAYSNQHGDERGLVIYHNKYESTRGWIKTSSAISVKSGNGDERVLIQRKLGEGLGLHNDGRYFVIFRDHIRGLEYIRNSRDIFDRGLYVELHAFQTHVFLDFREVEDNVWHHYGNLAAYLDGRGVPNMEEALRETFLQPIHRPFKELVNAEMFRALMDARILDPKVKADKKQLKVVEEKMLRLLGEIKSYENGTGDQQKTASLLKEELRAILGIPVISKRVTCPHSRKFQSTAKLLNNHFDSRPLHWYVLFGWHMTHRLGEMVAPEDFEEQSRSGIDEWLLRKVLENCFYDLGIPGNDVQRSILIIKILTRHQNWWKTEAPKKNRVPAVLRKLLQDYEVRDWLQVNRYHDVLWFNHESFLELMNWLLGIAVLDSLKSGITDATAICAEIIERYDIVNSLLKGEKKAEYQIDKLMEIFNK